jgi:hypothetical protein
MSIFGKEKDDDPSTGSGEGGTLGTPASDNTEDVPSSDDETMVVSGGGVADTSEEDAAAAGDRGLG